MPEQSPDVRWWQRIAQRIASSRTGAWLLSHTLHSLDRILLGLSGGRFSIPEVFAGLPVVQLTTTGAKSGREHTVPVVGLQDGEDWILVASNWGGERHPAWYHNLQANPEVELAVADDPESYVARDATDAEYADYWEWAVDRYPGFEAYRRRCGDRTIPIVVLEPADGTNA